MIQDMERAIYKRDNIEAKGKTMAGKKGAPPTSAALAKQLAELTKKLKLTTHDANLSQMAVLKLQQTQAERGAQVDEAAGYATGGEERDLSARCEITFATKLLRRRNCCLLIYTRRSVDPQWRFLGRALRGSWVF